jgi:redox-sensing transcriptional repressor
VAVFDSDPRLIGQIHDGLRVEPLESLRKIVSSHKISLGLLCVPADAAQRVAEQMVAGGITGILNFAPVPLVVPRSVNVVAVDLSVQLENLAYKVQKTQEGVPCAG